MMEGLETKRQLPVPGNIWSSPTAPPPPTYPSSNPPLRLKDKMLGHFKLVMLFSFRCSHKKNYYGWLFSTNG